LFRKQYLKRKYEIFLDEDLSETLASLDHNIEKLFDLNIDIDIAVSKILKGLNEYEYILYVDYYKNYMTVTEIADKYNISTTAVTTRIYRLKKKIKFLIHKYIENI
jgi:RNA polymerase sigma-70 factor (ECF subfamily)